jgi:hypothetical protein
MLCASDDTLLLDERVRLDPDKSGAILVRRHRDHIPRLAGWPVGTLTDPKVSVDEALAALDPAHREPVIAEDRRRAATGTGVDAVIRARRLS